MRKLITYILGDSSSLERALKRSTAATREFEAATVTPLGRVDGAFKKISGLRTGAFVGGAAITGAVITVKKLTGAASDLNEQITKNQQVFGASAKSVQAWSETTAKSIGVSEQAALGATGTFGNLFTAIGISEEPAAQMSTRLVQLAADLASFNNASIEDTLDAIRSGLVGETEPMRRYGVLLSATRVQQQAMAETGKTNAKSLTEQEKAAARVTLIFKDTAKAQGDFARTSGGLANQQRILSAEVQDLEANLGKLLLPAMTKITGAAVDATGATLGLIDQLKKLGKVKIPTIHIPFLFDLPGTGGTVGSAAKIFGRVSLGLSTLGMSELAIQIAKRLGDEADDATKRQIPDLTARFEKSINSMIDTSLTAAAQNIDPNVNVSLPPLNVTFTDLLFNVGIAGFGTGATPEDILGPLLKELPNKFTEQILDAEIAGKGIREAHVAARDKILAALDDPRLKAKDRIALKRALKSEQDAIESIDDQAAADADQRAKDAQTKRENLRDKRAKERQKERERRERIRERERKAALRAAARLQTRQFRAIGLGPEGSEIVPTVKNLRKQFEQLGANIEPGQLSSKLRKQFAGVGKLLRGDLGKLTEATREKIRDLFRTIRGEFEHGATDVLKVNPRTQAINKNAILAGLGLDRDTEREIRSRLSGFNQAGRRLAPTAGTHGAFGITITPQPIQVNTTVNLDGSKVARNTTIHQQKNKRSNPAQKRGPLRGI